MCVCVQAFKALLETSFWKALKESQAIVMGQKPFSIHLLEIPSGLMSLFICYLSVTHWNMSLDPYIAFRFSTMLMGQWSASTPSFISTLFGFAVFIHHSLNLGFF